MITHKHVIISSIYANEQDEKLLTNAHRNNMHLYKIIKKESSTNSSNSKSYNYYNDKVFIRQFQR